MSNPLMTAIDLGTKLVLCKHRLAVAEAALAGLEPSEVKTLVELVQRCVAYHSDSSLSEAERALIARLPK